MSVYTYIIETSQITHLDKMTEVLEDTYGRGRYGVHWLGPTGYRIKVTTHDPTAPWERLRAAGMVCQALQIDAGIVNKGKQSDMDRSYLTISKSR
jgi:hypothetical protein